MALQAGPAGGAVQQGGFRDGLGHCGALGGEAGRTVGERGIGGFVFPILRSDRARTRARAGVRSRSWKRLERRVRQSAGVRRQNAGFRRGVRGAAIDLRQCRLTTVGGNERKTRRPSTGRRRARPRKAGNRYAGDCRPL